MLSQLDLICAPRRETILLSLVDLVRGIDQYRYPRCRWNGGLQQLKLLCDEVFGNQCREAGHVAPGMCEALDETDRDRIGDRNEDKRDRRRRVANCNRVWRSNRDDDLWVKRNKLS